MMTSRKRSSPATYVPGKFRKRVAKNDKVSNPLPSELHNGEKQNLPDTPTSINPNKLSEKYTTQNSSVCNSQNSPSDNKQHTGDQSPKNSSTQAKSQSTIVRSGIVSLQAENSPTPSSNLKTDDGILTTKPRENSGKRNAPSHAVAKSSSEGVEEGCAQKRGISTRQTNPIVSNTNTELEKADNSNETIAQHDFELAAPPTSKNHISAPSNHVAGLPKATPDAFRSTNLFQQLTSGIETNTNCLHNTNSVMNFIANKAETNGSLPVIQSQDANTIHFETVAQNQTNMMRSSAINTTPYSNAPLHDDLNSVQRIQDKTSIDFEQQTLSRNTSYRNQRHSDYFQHQHRFPPQQRSVHHHQPLPPSSSQLSQFHHMQQPQSHQYVTQPNYQRQQVQNQNHASMYPIRSNSTARIVDWQPGQHLLAIGDSQASNVQNLLRHGYSTVSKGQVKKSINNSSVIGHRDREMCEYQSNVVDNMPAKDNGTQRRQTNFNAQNYWQHNNQIETGQHMYQRKPAAKTMEFSSASHNHGVLRDRFDRRHLSENFSSDTPAQMKGMDCDQLDGKATLSTDSSNSSNRFNSKQAFSRSIAAHKTSGSSFADLQRTRRNFTKSNMEEEPSASLSGVYQK